MARTAIDTSVIIAALQSWHQDHDVALASLQKLLAEEQPILLPTRVKAGGAEVLIDRERFEAGKALLGQMDAVQDAAEASLLVLSPEYLASDPCRHEMERAVDLDPRFADGAVIPVMRRKCSLPDLLRGANPLYVDLRRDDNPEPSSCSTEPLAKMGRYSTASINPMSRFRRSLTSRPSSMPLAAARALRKPWTSSSR